MASSSRRTLSRRLLPLVVAAGLLLTACGERAGVAVLPGSPNTSQPTTSQPITAQPETSVPDTSQADASEPDTSEADTSEAGVGTSQGGGGYDQNRTAALDMSIRVANLYIPKGSSQGSAIEVWVGSPQYGGKKLQTVPYGQVSQFFAPEVMDPEGQGQTDPHMDYTVSFYLPGKTTGSNSLIDQSENASPGQKLTMVVAPSDPTEEGASLQVFADDLGSSPEGGGFHTLSVPQPPAGSAIILLDALALEYRGTDPNKFDSLTPSTVDGKCVQYIDPDTGKIHDPNSDTTDLFGGTESLPYVVAPGAKIRVNVVKDQQSVTDACASAPVVGPIDPGLAAGKGAYGFVYGTNLKTAKLLVFPVG